MKLGLSRFLLALFLIAVVRADEGECAAGQEESCANPEVARVAEGDPNCPAREYVIQCAGEYLDTNKNGKLERAELQTAIEKLPWYARGEFFSQTRC